MSKKPITFAELTKRQQEIKAEADAKVKADSDALEAEMWASMGIKPEDLYSPEERAERFDKLLGIMIKSPPMTQAEVRQAAKEYRESRKRKGS
jgi:hypothetical protein